MTHTSTEQPEALRLADALRDGQYSLYQERAATEAELRRLHARVQELEAQTAHMADLVELADYATKKLEASQAQRVPLSDFIETLAQNWDGCMYDAPGEYLDIGASIRREAITHGITQEKQG